LGFGVCARRKHRAQGVRKGLEGFSHAMGGAGAKRSPEKPGGFTPAGVNPCARIMNYYTMGLCYDGAA
jgi:hypothetical protein